MDKRQWIAFYKRAFAIIFALIPGLLLFDVLVLEPSGLPNYLIILVNVFVILFFIGLVELIRSKRNLKKEMKENAKK